MKQIFEIEYLIPQKPCTPVQPPAYGGPIFTFDATQRTPANMVAGNYLLLKTAYDNTNTWTPKRRTLRTGFMQANSASSGTITPQWVGHVFGRMGQGARTTPGETDF